MSQIPFQPSHLQ